MPSHAPRPRIAQRLAALLLCLPIAACSTGGDAAVTATTWDLRDTRDISAIGWPTDVDGTGWSVPDGTVAEVRVGDDTTLEVAGTRVVAGRDGDALEEVVLRFPDDTVEGALERARGLAEQIGADPAPLVRWAARNATRVDLSAAGNDAFTEGRVGDLTVTIAVRSPEDGVGTTSLELYWPRTPP